MATFVALPDTDLDANSPITESLMLALRDNPLAIAQGDISAPNIASEAFADNSIGWEKLLKTNVFFTLNGGDSIVLITNSTSYIVPNGVYNIILIASLRLEIFISGSWRSTTVIASGSGTIISDGSNIRVFNTSTTTSYNIYLKKVG